VGRVHRFLPAVGVTKFSFLVDATAE
jgi:hypothetical protein